MGLISKLGSLFGTPETQKAAPLKMSEMDLGQKKPACALAGASFSRSSSVRTTTPAPSGIKIDPQMAMADKILGNNNWTVDQRSCAGITRNTNKSETQTNLAFHEQSPGALDAPNNSAAARHVAKIKAIEGEGRDRQMKPETKAIFAASEEKHTRSVSEAKALTDKARPTARGMHS